MYRLAAPILLLAATLPFAAANGAPPPAVRVNVYQYAVDNPVENAVLTSAPTIGASVPAAVTLAPCRDEKTYAYFYYDGVPVIVDRSTRSIVRIGAK